jgi:outer membrane immunogenic protein
MLTDLYRKLGVAIALLLLGAAGAHGQVATSIDAFVGYSYFHANAPPGECGCFSMNGGTGEFSTLLGHGISALVDVGGYYQGNVDKTGRTLQVETFLFGPRFSTHHWRRVTLFGESMFGGSMGSGTLYGPNATTSGTASGFSLGAGGGVDLNVSRRISVRVLQADYVLTRMPNFFDNTQNNLRFNFGLVFHFGQGR